VLGQQNMAVFLLMLLLLQELAFVTTKLGNLVRT